MRDLWENILHKIWGDQGEGFAFIAYRMSSGYFKQTPFPYPDHMGALLDHLEEANKWADIYFCPHLFTEARRQKDAVKHLNVLWVDKDKGKLQDIQDPKPTFLWETSKGKYQAIWKIKQLEDPKRVERLNQYLTYKTNSDSGGWHLGKFLRLPESLNHKYSPPQEGKLKTKNGPEYVIEDLEPTEDDMKDLIEEYKGSDKTEMPESLPPLEQIFLQYGKDIPPIAWKIIETEPKEGDDWSAQLWRLERLLREAGLPLEATFQLVKNSPWNKYARDNRSDKDLWNDVSKAYRYGAPEEFKDGMNWSNIGDLILYQEKPEWLVDEIWMDKNVGWLAGVGKSYKTVLSLDLALSIASGKPFLGKFPVNKPGSVLMIQEEDPKWRLAHRVRIMADQKGITTMKTEFMPNKLVVEYGGLSIPFYTAVGQGFLFEDQEKIQAVEEAIEDYRPQMVIFDPLFMMTPGYDEYKSGEITRVLNQLKYWRNVYGCSICVVHHFNKDSQQGDYTQRLYGSMALYAWSENSLFVEKQRDSNIAMIQRDIKDALVSEKISVEFLELDDRYEFEVRDDLAKAEGYDKNSNKGKVIQYLMNHTPGSSITHKQIKQALNVADRSLRDIVDELESENVIIKERKGRGGQTVITTTTRLFDEYGERGLDLRW